MNQSLDPAGFRALFPALAGQVWLDTPATPPGAIPVTSALTKAISAWQDGTLGSDEWGAEIPAARSQFARYLGVPAGHVALMGSVAEAATTVAMSLPERNGTIVVGDEEFRSNLFPWLALRARGYRVLRPTTGPDGRTESLLAAIDDSTVLVAVSDVLSRDGERTDLVRLRAATCAAGARLFVDATQSLGVLRPRPAEVQPDYLAVHGYKWLLCPRGAAWLVTQHSEELRPLLPSWTTTADRGYFGGWPLPAPGAAGCDTPPAWLSWIGARAAIDLMSELPQAAVERHCLALADAFRERARAAGAIPAGAGRPSHIVAVRVTDPDAVRRRLASMRVRARILGDRLRVGFHYFNDVNDVTAALRVLTG
jgi:selenocysteine lyase/cysteine desulfurase